MSSRPSISWVLDSGGAGRGAWQGGILHELMKWCRDRRCFPTVMMGASAGGYAAADVATGTEATVMKGWLRWGADEVPRPSGLRPEHRSFGGLGEFRTHLRNSIGYVMGDAESSAIFDRGANRRLAIFTTRIRRRNGSHFGSSDELRLFLRASTRKLPKPLKYLPGGYQEDPVVFVHPLPPGLESEQVRPLTRTNFHAVLEATCLVPLAMGSPIQPDDLLQARGSAVRPSDQGAVYIDGGYTMKMPMAMFAENPAFRDLSSWLRTARTLVICCDPSGGLWETSFRLRRLNEVPAVAGAIGRGDLLVIHPDHPIEAGFMCHDNAVVMRTFDRGRQQARRLLQTDWLLRFFE
jgi:hypothetical protein